MLRLRWVLFYAGVTFIVSICLVTFIKELSRVEGLSDSLDLRMEEFISANRRHQILKEKIEYYKTPSGRASLAREKFNLVKPGETLYVVEVVSPDRLR